MKTNPTSKSGIFYPRVLPAFVFCSVGFFLVALGFAANPGTPGWSLITSANTSATQTNYLNGVTCASANDCWAVGYYDSSATVAQTLIEHWNGTAWSIVPSPNTSATQTNHLTNVACTSAANCWAVGYYYTGSGTGGFAQTLVERWNGTSWSIAPSNNSSSTQNNYLFGVTCASAANCWAVGSFFNGSYTQTLIERWDGTSWAIATSPLASYYLNDVTCASANDCWAVGSTYPTGITHAQTLIEHWDGASWAIVSSPDPTDVGDNYLSSVTCTSTADCWAVGYYDPNGTGGETALPFIEHWNGASVCPTCPSWSIFPSPNNGVAYLTGVTCTSPSACWAVGYGIDPNTSPVYYTQIEQWNGNSWQFVTSPNRPSPNNNYLTGVACASASACWAVGNSAYNQAGPHAQTLIEEFAPTIPPLTAIGSRKIHGSTPFDVDLLNIPPSPPGIECRSVGGTGTAGVDYKIVFSFVNNVTNCGNASTGSLSSGPNLNQCTVDLTGIADQQYVTVNLNNVLDSQTNTGNVSATMGVLLGDVNANGLVNSTDTTLVQAQSGKALTLSNFRMDVNHNGLINSTDTSAVQAGSGHGLPPPPP